MTNAPAPPAPLATVTLIRTGIANTASVAAAFERIGAIVELTNNPTSIQNADFLVLPGVGAFAAGMKRLRDMKVDRIIAQRIQDNRPTLAVCLGLQLLANSSDESPDATGLAIIPAHAQRFPETAQIPQFGWNRVNPDNDFNLATPGYAYFANSYRLTECPEGWAAAWATHAGPFIAALRRGRVLACQFHPELSGEWGQALLTNWLTADVKEPCAC